MLDCVTIYLTFGFVWLALLQHFRGNKRGPEFQKFIWVNLLHFFCTILFYFSFLYVYCFYCCSLICFVYICSSLCAYSVWLLRLPFRGFPSLMWSIQEEVVGCDGCYSCMSLWAVCFAWLNYIEVHLQILNVTFVGHLSHCQVKQLCFWYDTLFTIIPKLLLQYFAHHMLFVPCCTMGSGSHWLTTSMALNPNAKTTL